MRWSVLACVKGEVKAANASRLRSFSLSFLAFVCAALELAPGKKGSFGFRGSTSGSRRCASKSSSGKRSRIPGSAVVGADPLALVEFGIESSVASGGARLAESAAVVVLFPLPVSISRLSTSPPGSLDGVLRPTLMFAVDSSLFDRNCPGSAEGERGGERAGAACIIIASERNLS